MKLIFTLPFQPTADESLLILGNAPSLGQWDPLRSLRMYHQPTGLWRTEIQLSRGECEPFFYRYALVNRDTGIILKEGGADRIFTPPPFSDDLIVEQRDFWQPPSGPEDILLTAPFRNAIFRHAEAGSLYEGGIGDRNDGVHVRLRVSAPRVSPDAFLYVTGNIPALGLWNPQRALRLHTCSLPSWEVDFGVRPVEIPFHYKYFIADDEIKGMIWEEGENRHLTELDTAGDDVENTVLSVSDYAFRHPSDPWKGAGLAIPVFSLRSEKGLGVGEFSDLKLLVDWAKALGMQIIQILPVNDTSVRLGRTDSYPYSLLSAFALHPIYLNLRAIGGLSETLMLEINDVAKALNAKSALDYEAVMSAKTGFLKRVFSEQASSFLRSEAFQQFLEEQALWIKPYAAFCTLRDRFGTSSHWDWEAFSPVSPEAIERLTDPCGPHAQETAFHYFVQYHLHRQLQDAVQYAHQQGIALKGDIPIGVDKASVETWLHPECFNMDKSTGAPPDDFAPEGQNWGFPTYHWNAMSADGYTWWKERLTHLSRYFDAVRLDHIIGFFRIWEIPDDAVTALRGRFSPAIPLLRTELATAGLTDVEAFCNPHITDEILLKEFGQRADEVRQNYLEASGPGQYRFRPEFDTQKKIAAFFSSSPGNNLTFRPDLLRKLLRLHDEVLLIPDRPDDHQMFHPRIAMMTTCAFKDLDERTQVILQRFYQDYFFERQEALWAEGAVARLTALKTATGMLVCGEDLGMIPACVPAVMEKHHLLGLRIQRMPSKPGDIFEDLAEYPYLSVASPSSHDMSTIRGWWEETDRAIVQIYYRELLGYQGVAPKLCEPWICRDMIALHLNSSSMWAIFPVQDVLSLNAMLRRPDPHEERINEPATSDFNWHFRLHRTLEDLLSQLSFNATVRKMVIAAGRLTNQ